MIGRIRRWRLLALLLLFATPGLAGTALDGLHPCPENAPAAADASAGSDDHSAHSGDHGEAPQHEGRCHCLGACVAAAATVPFSARLPIVAFAAGGDAEVLAAPVDIRTSRPSDRLPPSTAPPLG